MYILGGLESRDFFKCVFTVGNSSVCAQWQDRTPQMQPPDGIQIFFLLGSDF